MADPATKAKRAYSAPALERGFDIIELLATAPGGLTISEIASQLGRSMGEVFRVIMVMDRRGWLGKKPDSDRYGVTYRVLDLAYRATPAQALAQVAAPLMSGLTLATNQSCHLVVRVQGRGLIIQRQESSGPAGFAMRMGTSIDLVKSCSGHVLLAFESPERREVAIGLMEESTRAAAHQLAPQLDLVRERGYEMRASGQTAGVTEMSCPVFGFDNRVVAALTIPYLVMIDGRKRPDIDQALELLRVAARDISTGIGWHG